jgi:H+-transporting ATPase
VLPLFDPPRDDAKATVATAAAMGVKIKMVTGDALAIARETAKTLGMGTNILDGATLGDSKTKETAAVTKSIEDADGFAQVFPEHKFHIVDVLQKHGHIVGMTGDGVNDAPALKKADCGFAVSGATDAARAAASIVLVAPGLSVIIDAIKESRRIFQRMNSYAIYRIAETLRVLFFMTLAIVVFNFYPLTAVMIVMLALLNDGAILSIAYDNVHYKSAPEAWNMRQVLGVSTVLGVFGVMAAFGLFYLGERVFHLDRAHIQTMMYLKLSVAGHLTIFLTRTRGPFWSIRPARILWMAVLGTQAVATCIAIFGLGLVTPLGWYWALLVWGYALAWALVNDRAKLLTYWVLDTVKGGPKSDAKAEPRPDVAAELKPKAKAAPEGNAEPDPKPASDVKSAPQPAALEIPKGGSKPDAKADRGPNVAAELKPEAKAAPEGNAEPNLKPQSDAKSAPPPAAKAEQKLQADPDVATLLNTSLGEILVAGLVKDPEDAGRIIAAALTQVEAPATAPEDARKPQAKAEPEAKSAPQPDEIKTSSDPTDRTGK